MQLLMMRPYWMAKGMSARSSARAEVPKTALRAARVFGEVLVGLIDPTQPYVRAAMPRMLDRRRATASSGLRKTAICSSRSNCPDGGGALPARMSLMFCRRGQLRPCGHTHITLLLPTASRKGRHV